MLTLMSVSCSVKDNNKDDCEGGLLWQISGNGLRDTSYLFGTMHSVEYTFLDSVQGFNRIFQKVKNVSTEADRYNLPYTPLKPPYPDYYYLPDDTTYKVLYPNNNDYILVDSVLRKINIAYFYYKPIFLSDIITSKYAYSKLYKQNEISIDNSILSNAYKQNKNIRPLEYKKEDFQYKTIIDSLLFTSISLKDQAEALLFIIKNEKMFLENNDKFQEQYKKQGLNLLYEYFPENKHNVNLKESSQNERKYSGVTKKCYEILGAGRNHNWMKKLPEIMNSGSTLIAVGAAHLMGDEGLISLLRKEGYKVEPIN